VTETNNLKVVGYFFCVVIPGGYHPISQAKKKSNNNNKHSIFKKACKVLMHHKVAFKYKGKTRSRILTNMYVALMRIRATSLPIA
jgi:uncharacterized membrane protein YiaA